MSNKKRLPDRKELEAEANKKESIDDFLKTIFESDIQNKSRLLRDIANLGKGEIEK